MIVVVAGVCGTGKSTIGQLLAKQLNIPFYDADDFHPDANVKKMSNGIPLDDNDRLPWLNSLSRLLSDSEKADGCVLACSALKEKYRKRLCESGSIEINWLFLVGSYELLKQRLSGREDHFFDNTLLSSQLSTLELPDYGVHIEINQTVSTIVKQAVNSLSEN